ncbi:MAG: carboxypeptidase-like regulatory domain-containing protein [Acidobacteriota bacterium]|nr:carboxypeptidase-like regulatory domain-containing protein [Acidobacteriota bacterium]
MFKYFLLIIATCPLMAGTLSGTITQDNGQPYASSAVSALDAKYLCLVQGTATDASGNYTLSDLPDGQYYLQIGGETVPLRYDGNTDRRNVGTANVIDVNGNTTYNFTVPTGGVIQGNVSIQGGSLANARVFLIDVFSGTEVVARSVELSGNGNYTISPLETGCYLVGLGYDPNNPEAGSVSFPQVFYGGLTPETATRVDVTAGQTTSGIDIDMNLSQLGTYRVTLNAPDLEDSADITVFDDLNIATSVDLSNSMPTDILLPPGTYRASLTYSDTYLDSFDNNPFTITAGGVTTRTYNADRGGSIQGTITFDPVRQFGQTCEVQAIDKTTGIIVESQNLILSNPLGTITYNLSGLPDDDYAVRITPTVTIGFNPLFQDSFVRKFHPNSNTLAGSGTYSISNASTRTGVDFILDPGSAFLIGLTENGGPPAVTPTVVVAEAIEVNTGEIYTGGYIPGFGGGIFGLPEGTYKVGLGTGLSDVNTLNSALISLGTIFCPNLGPAWHENAETLETATAFQVEAAPDLVTTRNIEMRQGGMITGTVLAGDCNYPASTAWVGAFQNDRLVRLALPFSKDFELGALAPGSYTLRAILPTTRGEDLPDLNDFFSGVITIESLFDIFRDFTYSTSVSVTRGNVTDIGNWCLDIDALGNSNGGGNGGGGDDETSLLYAWISNRADQFESILVANNTGSEAVDVTLTATRNGGESETITRNIPANGFLEEQASSLFPTLGDGAGYSVLLTAPNDMVKGRWVTNNLTSATGRSPSQGVAVRIPDSGETERVGQNLLFSYLPTTNNFISAPVVVNVGDAPTDVTLRYYNAGGSLVSTNTLEDLAPNQPFAQVVGTADNVYMTAESGGEPITGVSFVFNNVGETAIGNATTIDTTGGDDGSKTLLYPWVSNRENQFESIVIANNYSDNPVTVTMTARRSDGSTETVNRQIGANGFLEEQASSLFPTLGSGGGYAVELTAPTSRLVGGWVTNNLTAASMASPSQGIAVDIGGSGEQRVGDKVLFGYLPLTNDFISAPVVVNAGDTATDITLTFYDAAGNQVGQDTQTLAASAPLLPFATVASNLVNTDGNVYMVAESSGSTPITGVVFVFNSAGETAIGNVTAID